MYNSELTSERKLAILDIVESGNGDLIDVHAMKAMRAKGFVETANIKIGTKGRPPLAYKVSGKGRSLIALIERNQMKAAK